MVLEPAAGAHPRRTLVLRTGPPERKGQTLDLILGVLGALLLVGAVALVSTLPERDIILPQFRVTPVDALGEYPSRTGNLTDQAGTVELEYQVPADNVHAVLVVLGFEDDVASSLTDTLRVELFDPLGNPVGGERIASTERPLPPVIEETGPLAYTAVHVSPRFLFSTAPKPEEQIAPGLTEDETADEVKDRLEADAFQATAGMWRVRVSIVASGDCPDQNEPDTQRVLSCRLETQGSGEDPGNPFTIEKFEYTAFSLAVSELD